MWHWSRRADVMVQAKEEANSDSHCAGKQSPLNERPWDQQNSVPVTSICTVSFRNYAQIFTTSDSGLVHCLADRQVNTTRYPFDTGIPLEENQSSSTNESNRDPSSKPNSPYQLTSKAVDGLSSISHLSKANSNDEHYGNAITGVQSLRAWNSSLTWPCWLATRSPARESCA